MLDKKERKRKLKENVNMMMDSTEEEEKMLCHCKPARKMSEEMLCCEDNCGMAEEPVKKMLDELCNL